MFWKQLAAIAFILTTLSTAYAQSDTPYAGQDKRAIKALSDEEIQNLLDARGMGLAKAAELNSYPGPMHVLQLTKELQLTDAQHAATEALIVKMRNEAQPIGLRIISAERDLDQAFAHRKITPTMLKKYTDRIGILQGQLRNIHLRTHLAQRAIMTNEQIARYDRLRGYAGSETQQIQHRHGG